MDEPARLPDWLAAEVASWPQDVNIVEAESAAVIAEVSISLGARGSVHTQSYEMLEVDQLIKLLGG